jgi:hypothetical protein
VAPCGLLTGHQSFGEKTASIFRAEYEGSIFIRNVGAHLQAHIVSPNQKTTMTVFSVMRTSIVPVLGQVQKKNCLLK